MKASEVLESLESRKRPEKSVQEDFINIAKDKWKMPSTSPLLKEGEIDLWCVDLDAAQANCSSLFKLLSDDEKQRADKYVFARDKERFIACRAALRRIISGYLGKDPETIKLLTRKYGKPYLSSEDLDLRFNVSHAHGIAVVAATLNQEVGVDIEFVDRSFDIFSVAPSVFSEAEVSRMRSLPLDSQADTFFAGWTRKEAFLKAMGDGLSSPDDLQRALSLVGDAVMFRSFGNNKYTDWSLTSFEIRENFKGSLVVEGKIGDIRYWKLMGDFGLESPMKTSCRVEEHRSVGANEEHFSLS